MFFKRWFWRMFLFFIAAIFAYQFWIFSQIVYWNYFNPSSSWWYVQGGPRPLTYRQFLLRVSPGFERNATVGFRCVKDRSK